MQLIPERGVLKSCSKTAVDDATHGPRRYRRRGSRDDSELQVHLVSPADINEQGGLREPESRNAN